ncbi:hypothetical protein U9M48_032391 [Paspalum notatum var. saurae]|uniref:Uncharacterized protein n=1 Tax=Paspalum notatum var. saurae TaxID=547442 RepID=A0AAQ3X4F5_PASNO
MVFGSGAGSGTGRTRNTEVGQSHDDTCPGKASREAGCCARSFLSVWRRHAVNAGRRNMWVPGGVRRGLRGRRSRAQRVGRAAGWAGKGR